MADFTSEEKINVSLKHFLGILGTNNLDGSAGRRYYEEMYPASHPVYLPDAWSEVIPYASTKTQALLNIGEVIEDRSSGESITLVQSGSSWTIETSNITPAVGYQITDIFPSPTYIKSITDVVDNGSGSYTITLNDNSGVVAGSAVIHNRIFLTLDPTSNNLTWLALKAQGDFFSERIKDFISPFDFGRGYSLNLFQADGTPIYVAGVGTWFFKWEEGILTFPDGQTAADLGYQTPLYIEGFRYIGDTGSTSSLSLSNGAEDNQTLRWDETQEEWLPTSDMYLTTSGAIVPSRLEIDEQLVLYSGAAPISTLSPGLEGEIRWDSNFLYINTGAWGWKRHSLAEFNGSTGLPTPPLTASGSLGLGGVFKADFEPDQNLDVTVSGLDLQAADVNVGNIFSGVSSSDIKLSERGLYRVTWNVRGELIGGSTQRRVLTTGLVVDGEVIESSKADGFVNDSVNNHTCSQNTYLISTLTQNQIISIKSDQTGLGGGPGSFLLVGGHLLVEYIGAV